MPGLTQEDVSKKKLVEFIQKLLPFVKNSDELSRLEEIPVYQWTHEDVLGWMKDIRKKCRRLTKIETNFKESNITGRELLILNEENLQSMTEFVSELKRLQNFGKYVAMDSRK
jgi:hypothetical protein